MFLLSELIYFQSAVSETGNCYSLAPQLSAIITSRQTLTVSFAFTASKRLVCTGYLFPVSHSN